VSAELWSLLGNFGPMGVFVAYLVWRESTTTAERIKYDTARLEADRALAASLGALTAVIQRLDK
jgi:hypothetical protein